VLFILFFFLKEKGNKTVSSSKYREKMRIQFKKYPIDILLFVAWSTIILPIATLNMEGTVRIILGLPFILFIPGYVLLFVLFPTRKTDKGIDTIERIVLSFGLSIAIVPLIRLGLNYTPWGIRLQPILLSVFIFIIGVGSIAFYRWTKTSTSERFTVTLDVSLPKAEQRIDRALTLILGVAIIIAVTSLAYVIVAPKTGEKFTEFYLLNAERRADNYPTNLTVGEEASVIIGITDHEYRPITYTVEVWLINQTMVYNNSTHNNETLYTHAWFMDSVTVMLNHTAVDIEAVWEPQWEYNYTFTINQKGEDLELAFLLFTTTPTDTYNHDRDYKNSIAEKITNAYREIHLFVTVS
jgi:uncharacterized membrane protein